MDKIYFTVNGDHYSLSGSEVGPTTSLSDYLRNYLQLHGTKTMCHEGGCGACVVSVLLPGTKRREVSVNSCLVHILSCHQWDITTIEGVGNRKDGYHPIQTRLAAFNGTQCGYCTPGWVMNMYSLYQNSTKLTMEQIERSFGGNMCRCTGYRPILDAFKSFAVDKDTSIYDIEDLSEKQCKPGGTCKRRCSVLDEEWCLVDNETGLLKELHTDKGRWYKAYKTEDVFKILNKEGTDSYMLVAGNTGKGKI
ncbi:hypothetical protein O0L34_g13616 [Tuta absoluta]|nr:hypothetical protein O0L34_g13616 [Tuta absoluta]